MLVYCPHCQEFGSFVTEIALPGVVPDMLAAAESVAAKLVRQELFHCHGCHGRLIVQGRG